MSASPFKKFVKEEDDGDDNESEDDNEGGGDGDDGDDGDDGSERSEDSGSASEETKAFLAPDGGESTTPGGSAAEKPFEGVLALNQRSQGVFVDPTAMHWKKGQYTVLKQVHPDVTLSLSAARIASDMITVTLESMYPIMVQLAKRAKRCSIEVADVQTAVRFHLPGELAKHAVSEGTKAVAKYSASGATTANAKSAGLCWDVTKTKRVLQSFSLIAPPISHEAVIYASAVMEYLTAEILELAGNAARDNKKIRIIPRHILLAVANDEELEKMFLRRKGTIASSGVLPCIHMMLIPKSMGKPAAF